MSDDMPNQFFQYCGCDTCAEWRKLRREDREEFSKRAPNIVDHFYEITEKLQKTVPASPEPCKHEPMGDVWVEINCEKCGVKLRATGWEEVK